MAIVSTTAWIGMGIGSFQAGFFYDLQKSYVLSYGNAALAGIVNLLIVAALFWYRAPGHNDCFQRRSIRPLLAGHVRQRRKQNYARNDHQIEGLSAEPGSRSIRILAL